MYRNKLSISVFLQLLTSTKTKFFSPLLSEIVNDIYASKRFDEMFNINNLVMSCGSSNTSQIKGGALLDAILEAEYVNKVVA